MERLLKKIDKVGLTASEISQMTAGRISITQATAWLKNKRFSASTEILLEVMCNIKEEPGFRGAMLPMIRTWFDTQCAEIHTALELKPGTSEGLCSGESPENLVWVNPPIEPQDTKKDSPKQLPKKEKAVENTAQELLRSNAYEALQVKEDSNSRNLPVGSSKIAAGTRYIRTPDGVFTAPEKPLILKCGSLFIRCKNVAGRPIEYVLV